MNLAAALAGLHVLDQFTGVVEFQARGGAERAENEAVDEAQGLLRSGHRLGGCAARGD